MTNRAGLSPIVCMLAMLLAPALGRAAEGPAATAAIPPPAPPAAVPKPAPTTALHKPSPAEAKASAVHKPAPPEAKAAAVSHTGQRHAAAAKKNARTVSGHKPGQVAQRHMRHRTVTHRPVVVRAVLPPPARPRRGYAEIPVFRPDGPPPSPWPPPWYDHARPAIAFAYPPPFIGPRGPIPWWVR